MNRAWLLAVLAGLGGCPPPTPPPRTAATVPAHCPEAPPVMSATEAVQELGRVARETRANLMARLEAAREEGAPATDQLFATLHTPGLALLEAALASPAKARKLDPVWMRDHLLTSFVEVHSPAPISKLDQGDVAGVALEDEEKQRHPALYMTRTEDRGGVTYRFFFDPLAFHIDRERMQMAFHLPGAGIARWRLSEEALSETDALPLLYLMSRVRSVRIARWALLEGDRAAARRMLEDALACAPDLSPAEELLSALKGAPAARGAPAPGSTGRTLRLSAAVPAPARRELGHDPVRDLALRAAMLARLTPLSAAGVVTPRNVEAMQETLREAVKAAEKGDWGWGLATALIDFDRRLAAALGRALDGADRPRAGATVPTLSLVGVPAPKAEAVDGELALRVLHANYKLVPRWVKGPAGNARPEGGTSHANLLELRPVLRADTGVVAKLHQRLGWGWAHRGLPPGSYSIRFVDHSSEHWRLELARIPASSIQAHRELARRLLHRAVHGPDPESAGLAMAGLVKLEREKALKLLLPLLRRGTEVQRVAALRAIAISPDDSTTKAIHEAASAEAPKLRAAAMVALARRALPKERALLRAGLKDRDEGVATAALEGLLGVGDPAGLVMAKTWLTSSDRSRRGVVLRLARKGKLRALGGDLIRLTTRSAAGAPEGLPEALVASLGRRAAKPLARLYDGGDKALRAAVLAAARAPAFERLLRRGVGEPEPALRRIAVLNLARLPRPPADVMRRALEDKDGLVQLAAHVGLARLGQASSLLALGRGARGSCADRAAVLPTLCRSMDGASRGKLLVDALESGCDALLQTAWELVLRYQPRDTGVLRAALGHEQRAMRVKGALAVLGLRKGAALGEW
jgi:hypothetical protein